MDELRKVTGLDVEKGLAVLANNSKIYLNILKKVDPTLEGALVDLERDKNDLSAVAKDAHAIKGVMYNVGAVMIGDMAKELETLAKSGEPIQAYLDEFVGKINVFREELDVALKKC